MPTSHSGLLTSAAVALVSVGAMFYFPYWLLGLLAVCGLVARLLLAQGTPHQDPWGEELPVIAPLEGGYQRPAPLKGAGEEDAPRQAELDVREIPKPGKLRSSASMLSLSTISSSASSTSPSLPASLPASSGAPSSNPSSGLFYPLSKNLTGHQAEGKPRESSVLSLIAKVKPILGQATDELLAELDAVKNADPEKFRLQDLSQNSRWKFVCHERGILVLKNSVTPGSGLSVICKTLVPFSSVDAFDTLRNLAQAPEVDFLLHSLEILEKMDEETFLLHLVYKGEKCTKENTRDFCVIYHASKVSNGRYRIIIKSLLSSRCVPSSDCLRGEVLTSGWIIDSVGPDSAMVTLLTQLDPKQPFPTTVYDLVFSNQMQTVYNLKTFQLRT